MAIDIILRLLGDGDSARAAFKGVRDEATKTERAVENIGKNPGLDRAEAKAKSYWQAIDTATDKTENLGRTLESARNWGAGIAVAGGAALVLASRLADVYREGARADEKLSAMMNKRGEGGRVEEMTDWAAELAKQAAMVDDDPIKEAAAGLYGFGLNAEQVQKVMPGLIGQSRLYGQSLDSVAQAFGRAYASGNASALKRSGVTISQADLDYIEAATTEIEKQHRMFEKVSESMEKYALSMTEGLSESEKAANRAALEMDNLETAIGKGAATAQDSFNNMTIGVLQYLGASEKAAAGVGWFLTMGGYAATAGGSIIALAGQVGMTTLALQGMGVQGVASLTAIRTASLGAAAALGKVLLVALLAAAAIYAVDKALHYKEDRELAANIAKGDATDQQRLDLANKARAKKGQRPLTMAEFEGDPNADDKVTGQDPAVQLANIQSQYDALQASGDGVSMGVVPSVAPVVAANTKASVPQKSGAAVPVAVVAATPAASTPAATTTTTTTPPRNPVADAIAALRGGASISTISKGGASGGSTSSGGTVTARVASQGFDAVGNWVVQFERLVIPPPRIAQAASRLRN